MRRRTRTDSARRGDSADNLLLLLLVPFAPAPTSLLRPRASLGGFFFGRGRGGSLVTLHLFESQGNGRLSVCLCDRACVWLDGFLLGKVGFGWMRVGFYWRRR